jgi:Outer membrane protein beta-barrel domain
LQTRTSLPTLLVAVVAVSIASAANAQRNSGPVYGALGGFGVPIGDLGDAVSVGFNAGAFAEGRPTGFPLGLRADAQYVRLSGKKGGDALNVIQATGNAVFDFPSSTGKKSPIYAIGGIGFYRSSGRGDSQTDFGFNIGGGYNFSPSTAYKPFVDARIHFVDDSEYIGFSIGFRF